jgi:hypothetical protein
MKARSLEVMYTRVAISSAKPARLTLFRQRAPHNVPLWISPPTAVHGVGKSKKSDPSLHAGKESDNTHGTYRVAAFQTFLSGRI